jgi:hypothetical protein
MMIFYFVFILRCRQADVFATVSSSLSLTQAINFVVTGDKLLPVSMLPAISYCRCF